MSRAQRAARSTAKGGPLRLGILGGTFDPPHVGHLALAEYAREELGLDRVLFVPAGDPPHKLRAARSSRAHRLAMTRLAVRGNAAFAVSDLEVRREGPSYTADTVATLARRYPNAGLWLLMGADMYATFGEWARPEEITARAHLAVALRPGVDVSIRARPGSKGPAVLELRNPGIEVSSSGIRTRARAGRSVRYLVPNAVALYLEKQRLYR